MVNWQAFTQTFDISMAPRWVLSTWPTQCLAGLRSSRKEPSCLDWWAPVSSISCNSLTTPLFVYVLFTFTDLPSVTALPPQPCLHGHCDTTILGNDDSIKIIFRANLILIKEGDSKSRVFSLMMIARARACTHILGRGPFNWLSTIAQTGLLQNFFLGLLKFKIKKKKEVTLGRFH